MNQAELLELAGLLKKIGGEVEVDREELEAYFPDIGNQNAMRDFYLPRVGSNFYFNSGVFRRLVTPTLRRL